MKKTFIFLVMFSMVVGLAWLGCDMEPSQVAGPDVGIGQAAKVALPDVAVERLIAVQEKHTERLLAIEGIVGTAVGVDENGNGAVIVLAKRPSIPGIPHVLEDVPVRVIVSGEFRALQGVDRTSRFDRPVPIGVSTGHPNITAGTIGCRVKDASGNVYALSNNHVYADENQASIGDNVLQPGPYDGGVNPADAIGTLYDFEPIKFSPSRNTRNTIDAAIALSSTEDLGTATPSDGYGTPSSIVAEATIGLQVQKYGRTTGLTTGPVEMINVTLNVGYDSGTARFVDQIIISSEGSFSLGGDSGSLVVTYNGNNPVGLLFAGNSDGTMTVINPIGLVLDRFEVSIDTGDGSEEPENNPPTADFSFTTSGLIVNFTDESTDSDGNIAERNWAFGDGATSTEQNPSHNYSADGTYPVTLTVTDDDGAEDSMSKNVIVTEPTNNPPTAGFEYSSTGLTVTFTDLSTDSDGSIAAWSWDFGDGSSSTERNPIHPYSTSGTYNVELTVTDDDGATDSISQDVEANEQGTPSPEVSYCDPNTGNPGQRLTVAVIGSNFQNGATVDFTGNGIVVQSVSSVGPGQLNVKINIQRKATTGPRDVTVTNPDGASGVLLDGFVIE